MMQAEGFTSRGQGIFLLGKLLPQQLQWSFIYEKKTQQIADSASNPKVQSEK